MGYYIFYVENRDNFECLNCKALKEEQNIKLKVGTRVKIDELYDTIDNKLPIEQEVYIFSSEDYPSEFNNLSKILFKSAIMNKNGEILRNSISEEEFETEEEALKSFLSQI